MGTGGQRHASAALTQGKTRYPLYRRLDRSNSRSSRVRKISSQLGFDSRTVQPVEYRHTDYTIMVQKVQVRFSIYIEVQNIKIECQMSVE